MYRQSDKIILIFDNLFCSLLHNLTVVTHMSANVCFCIYRNHMSRATYFIPSHQQTCKRQRDAIQVVSKQLDGNVFPRNLFCINSFSSFSFGWEMIFSLIAWVWMNFNESILSLQTNNHFQLPLNVSGEYMWVLKLHAIVIFFKI